MTSAATTKPESAPLLSAVGMYHFPSKIPSALSGSQPTWSRSLGGKRPRFPTHAPEGPYNWKVQVADELGARARKRVFMALCLSLSYTHSSSAGHVGNRVLGFREQPCPGQLRPVPPAPSLQPHSDSHPWGFQIV